MSAAPTPCCSPTVVEHCSTSAAPGLFSAGEDVYSCKEETDEKFQEVAARST
uniref:Uncharacterized protein n=1 Tax=Cucumis melo TaxID=3656 RepID=A0A9I9EJR5_CUCME